MANWQWFTKLHGAVYNATDGRLGANLGGIPMVLMHTVGARSGQRRSVPVACYPHPEGLLVFASNNGGPNMPAWWHNLRAHPECDIQFGREKRRVRAEQVDEQERLQYWPEMAKTNPRVDIYWRDATEKHGRTPPVVLLRTLEVLN
jgi:F420H(2)-dependent quinone reductase